MIAGASCKNLFYSYAVLEVVEFSGNFDTSHVTNMSRMFVWCDDLSDLNVDGWDTSNVTDMGRMFYDCSSLTSFDPDWLDTSNASVVDMYAGTVWE